MKGKRIVEKTNDVRSGARMHSLCAYNYRTDTHTVCLVVFLCSFVPRALLAVLVNIYINFLSRRVWQLIFLKKSI